MMMVKEEITNIMNLFVSIMVIQKFKMLKKR
jgi:hypothetical protein